jgi:hypothetical protein
MKIDRNELRKKSVAECLKMIHENKADENIIYEKSKFDLSDFILDIYNKGLLNDYLN